MVTPPGHHTFLDIIQTLKRMRCVRCGALAIAWRPGGPPRSSGMTKHGHVKIRMCDNISGLPFTVVGVINHASIARV